MDIQQSKKELRDTLKKQRQELSTIQLQAISEKITQRLTALSAFGNAMHINCFVGDSTRNEINTIPLISSILQLGKVASVPIMKDNYQLSFGQIFSIDDLVKNKWDIFEPKVECIPQVEPDLIIVPMLAADVQKNRLGYGAGYYDRLLSRFDSCISIGIVAQSFIFKKLPTDFYDIPMDKILTESSTIE